MGDLYNWNWKSRCLASSFTGKSENNGEMHSLPALWRTQRYFLIEAPLRILRAYIIFMREMFALHLHFNSQNLFLIFPVCTSFQRIFSYYFLNPQITFQFRRQLEWMNEKAKRSQRSHLKATFMKPSLCDLLLGAVMWV